MDSIVFPSISKKIQEFYPKRESRIQFELEHGRFAIGDLCTDEHLDGVRTLNAGPEDSNWRAIFHAAILKSGFDEAVVVLGAPKSHVDSLKAKFDVPFVVTGVTMDSKKASTRITDVLVVPEASGHALAYQEALKEEVLVISVGFGTVEVGAADETGVISSTLKSFDRGMATCAERVMCDLMGMGAAASVRDGGLHFWDDLVRDVHDGKQRDLPKSLSRGVVSSEDVRRVVNDNLRAHANELTTLLRGHLKTLRHRKFALILTGGGMLYSPVKVALESMAEQDNYELVDTTKEYRLKSAAMGYRSIGKEFFPGKNLIALDLGNHTTIAFYSKMGG